MNKAPGTEPPKDVADSMAEPFLSEFQAMVRAGASAQDIHDLPADAGFASTDAEVSDVYVRREVGRVRMHQRSLCPLLEKYVGPVDNILDVGCSTGGTTVAVALSQWLKPGRVVGVDPNGRALEGRPCPRPRVRAGPRPALVPTEPRRQATAVPRRQF
jgi:SAM-dependent methyltransferase